MMGSRTAIVLTIDANRSSAARNVIASKTAMTYSGTLDPTSKTNVNRMCRDSDVFVLGQIAKK